MTPEQYARWKDFAVRMARTCFAGQADPDPEWIEIHVRDFIEDYPEEDIPCIQNWDHADPYPQGSAYYKATRHVCWCQTSRNQDLQSPCSTCKGEGFRTSYARPTCMGDVFREWSDEAVYFQFYRLASEEEHEERDQIDSFEDEFGAAVDDVRYFFVASDPPKLLTTSRDDWMQDWEDQWSNPVGACVRAALDVAVGPSMGVSGFTAGDIRHMYPEGVPDWVQEFFTGAEIREVTGILPGIGFTDKAVAAAPPFEELPDDMHVWL